jgi:hypothetical protein
MHKFTKKFVFLIICGGALLITTINVFAMLPPKYLSIKDFKSCLATKDMDTWTAWCIPAEKPDACPDESWQQLNSLTGKDKVPNC